MVFRGHAEPVQPPASLVILPERVASSKRSVRATADCRLDFGVSLFQRKGVHLNKRAVCRAYSTQGR